MWLEPSTNNSCVSITSEGAGGMATLVQTSRRLCNGRASCKPEVSMIFPPDIDRVHYWSCSSSTPHADLDLDFVVLVTSIPITQLVPIYAGLASKERARVFVSCVVYGIGCLATFHKDVLVT